MPIVLTHLALAVLAAAAPTVAAAGTAGGARAARPAVRWLPPVDGAVMREFRYDGSPFLRGHHRGVDLAVAADAPVRVPCIGTVSYAGRLPAGGRAVTLRCGAWAVTLLPLAGLTVRAGARAIAGRTIGRVAPGHPGLHFGVRRASERFGYVDPLAFLSAARPAVPPIGPLPARPRAAPAGPRPAARAAPAGPVGDAPAPLAPWPAWLGLALVLAGIASGAGRARAGVPGPAEGRRARVAGSRSAYSRSSGP